MADAASRRISASAMDTAMLSYGTPSSVLESAGRQDEVTIQQLQLMINAW